MLLVLLGSVAVAAAWRAQKDQTTIGSLGHRTTVAAAIEKARSEYFHSATQLTAAILAEDPTPFIDSFHQGIAEGRQQLFAAQAELAALGDTDTAAALGSFLEENQQQIEQVDAIIDSAAASKVPLLTLFSQPRSLQIWDRDQTQLTELDGLANEQEAKLAAERAAGESSAEATLALMLGLSAIAFLVGAATLSRLLMSVVRPLAALRTSARAVATGDLETRARVAGPEEIASLARDFNEMVAQRGRAEEALRRQSHELGERAKELNCLYGISNLVQRPGISLEEILQGTVNLIPAAWQYPEITCARIVLGGQEHLTESFRETAWRQTSDIIVSGERTGAVEVCYLEEKPESDEGPFLTEERGLINAIAERLGRVSERRRAEAASRASEEKYRSLVQNIPDVVWTTDQNGRTVFISQNVKRVYGYTSEEILEGGDGIWFGRIHPDDIEGLKGSYTALFEKDALFDIEYRIKRKDGRWIWLHDRAMAVYEKNGIKYSDGIFVDTTERKKAEEALRESEERYRSIFESIQDIFYRTDAQGIITEISPSIERFGFTREALIGTPVLEVYENPEERAGLLKALLEQGDVADHEIRLKAEDGRLVSTSVSAHILRGPDGTLSGVEGILRDVSERKRAEEALRESEEALHEQARRDPLTGVLNHGAILDEMRSLISTDEHGARWAAAMIDVDRLKVANDTYGHQVGDAVILAVAAALSRDDALVGRYGGDEFLALLPGADRAAAEGYCSNATDALAHATITDPRTGAAVRAEASIGLAIYPEDATTLADLIKVSDNAMYAAKRQRPFRRPSPRKHAPDRKAA